MDDHRTEAELFVIEFLDYIQEYDILDEFDKRTQKMQRSAGVQKLVTQAQAVFPARKQGPTELTPEEVEAAIAVTPNVIDTREMFSRKIKDNGAARGLLRGVLEGDVTSVILAQEFISAEDGEKEFAVLPEKE